MCNLQISKKTQYKSTFNKEYKLSTVLGFGSYSVCRKCQHKATKKEFAVKVSLY